MKGFEGIYETNNDKLCRGFLNDFRPIWKYGYGVC